jgi:hypothetical protein
LTVQIASQRVLVKHALDTGQRLEMADSLLDALEGSVRIFEKHRTFLLSCGGSFSALPPGDTPDEPELVRTQRAWSVMTKMAFSADGDGVRRSLELPLKAR